MVSRVAALVQVISPGAGKWFCEDGDDRSLARECALPRAGRTVRPSARRHGPTGIGGQRAARYLACRRVAAPAGPAQLKLRNSRQSFRPRACGAFILCESVVLRQGRARQALLTTGCCSDPQPLSSSRVDDEGHRLGGAGATPRAALFRFPTRAAPPSGGAARKKNHRAVPSRNAARDGAIGAGRLRRPDEHHRDANKRKAGGDPPALPSCR